ncbi:hypothetical protein C4A76_24020 [Brevibacillus laterosporus]|uniref:Flp pilus assembly protein CpaB n=1 Tax=Brevibacillus laterosporus TaxID=1465 RepID=UPI000CE46C64|nr:RcpC/CpaB family pilus assembly protein [Brevibacillus laterosporus]PPA81158.1 hypothetical protein C4A76_24020 [Brevibacillus laterosporus]
MSASKKSAINRKKKNNTIIPLVLSVAVSCVFYVGVVKKTNADMKPIKVPFAAKTLIEHTEIKKEDINFVEIPSSSLPPNTVITDPYELLGKYVGTNFSVPKNGLFYKEAITTAEKIPSRINKLIEKGKYGLTMRVNLEKSVANSLKENMWVQVRFLTNKTKTNQTLEGILEEKIKILAVRDNSGQDIMRAENDKVKVPTIVVFEADEEQASYLSRAEALGNLSLVALSEADVPKENSEADNANEAESSSDKTNEAHSLNEQTSEKKVEELVNALGDKLTPEQKEMLTVMTKDKTIEERKGQEFKGNLVKLYIDSMTLNMETQFENNYYVSPKGEVIFLDRESNQLRYFKNISEFQESSYISQLSTQELQKVIDQGNRGTSNVSLVPKPATLPTSEPSAVKKETTNSNQQKSSVQDILKTLGPFNGKGKGVTNKVYLSKGVAVVSLKSAAQGKIQVTLMNPDGKVTSVIDEKQGVFEGSKAISIPLTGEYIFQVESNGIWSISIDQ